MTNIDKLIAEVVPKKIINAHDVSGFDFGFNYCRTKVIEALKRAHGKGYFVILDEPDYKGDSK